MKEKEPENNEGRKSKNEQIEAYLQKRYDFRFNIVNALYDFGCQNHTCLVLTGEQGRFKTTWLDHLCPQSLQNYLFTGKIDPQNKDILTLIAEYLFINASLKVDYNKNVWRDFGTNEGRLYH